MTEILASEASLTTKPSLDGEAPLPKRNGPKGLLPLSWTGRVVKLEYIDSSGRGQQTTATILDTFGFGPALNIAGARTLVSWDRLVLCELQEDR